MNWKKQLFPALAMMIVMTVITGLIYPLIVTTLSQLLFREQANGSLIIKDNRLVGSRLIGQQFSNGGYFHCRPSAAGNGYDATVSGGTNLGPISKKLLDERIKSTCEFHRVNNGNRVIPVDLVTSSASGLDPHITPAAAQYQVARVARARAISEDEVRRLVQQHTQARQLGLLGEPRVNVLELNLALDELKPISLK
jgi:potassium-transporting ATPase KdpC subunit